MHNILVCDDDRDIVAALKIYLSGGEYRVFEAYNGAEAVEAVRKNDIHLVLMDIMMPGLDGIAATAAIRRESNAPIILLTAKSESSDKVLGLNVGADDYITKPFDMGELLARVRAMTRRGDAYTPQVLRVGNLTLDRGTYEMAVDRQRIRLGNKEFQMLEMLMTTPRRLISTDQFLERIWGWDAEAENTVVWVYISGLRKKLASLKAGVEIRAVRGVGYALEERG